MKELKKAEKTESKPIMAPSMLTILTEFQDKKISRNDFFSRPPKTEIRKMPSFKLLHEPSSLQKSKKTSIGTKQRDSLTVTERIQTDPDVRFATDDSSAAPEQGP